MSSQDDRLAATAVDNYVIKDDKKESSSSNDVSVVMESEESCSHDNAKPTDELDSAEKEEPRNSVDATDTNRAKDSPAEIGSEKSKEGRKGKTIPEIDVLAVRYVKMREKKVPEPEKGLEQENKSGENEVAKMSEKLLEGVLGIKAERKTGERWVKLSEGEVESCAQITKRLDEVEAIVDKNEEIESSGKDANGKDAKRGDQEKTQNLKSMPRNLSNETSKFSRTRNLVRKDCISLAREIRARRKAKTTALKMSLERRVDSMEKVLEGQVGTILEDAADKHPWLQPIETWLLERYKSAKSLNSPNGRKTANRIARSSVSSDSELEIQKHRRKDVEEEEPSEVDGGEIFTETVNKVTKEEDKKKKNVSFSPASKLKDSIESLAESTGSKGPEENKEERAKSGKVEKSEKHHGSDLLEKLRGGFRETVEDVQRYFQRTSRLADVNRKLKSQIWSSVVTIVLVEAKNLLPMDIDGLSDPYVKFRLGTEKYKSKVINKTLSPVWLEQFDLHLYEDPYLGQELEVTVWDRDKSHQDDLMGRTTIDLASMERETTHRLWRDLEDGAGSIFLLLTISGTTASETISDLAAHEETPQERERLLQKYSLVNTFQRPRDVGHLTVKVYRAQGLAAADLGGKSDPFCVLELVNARLQTQTEYKTLAPNWQKIFTFNVKDINSVLEVTVYDEDRDHKVEFLGRVAIPLLRIRNAEKRWYALKDKKLRGRAKGNSPQIMLELSVVWNVFRACARTLNPKETKYMEPEVKFKRQVFLRNVLRLKAVIVFFIDMGKYIQSCWEWESKTRSIVALVLFVLGCYYFEPWMIPTAAFLILLKYCMVALLTGGSSSTYHHRSPSVGALHDTGDPASDDGPLTPGDDDDDEDDKDKEEKKSLKERLQAIQEVTQTVQNSIGFIASLCERIKNLFNFTVPYLSYLAIVLTILGAIVLYLIPMRYLILAWGVNKFLRKLLRPHSVPNNEVLDLISRVPDDEDLLSYRELKPVPTADCERGGTSSASTSSGVVNTRRDQRKKHKAA
ncbi:multiple C2 and transmembrane domain-containing protein isoform X1 [Venturia canescens]|uniref:multiple C2 and transmembrane domain-containing protein isoform X1 n=1 Tax=Venturia canescens TaxID=32260 RepID=UPI001C9C7BAB|nr:multiple C2 and transmembrane domain-containing protein isoform X1 [Venturia canescens]XP_043290082.1 multiple C2 and transmembrane domain-containing protein isoform X1 [Venturia canescens]